jgi:hypothetical protein
LWGTTDLTPGSTSSGSLSPGAAEEVKSERVGDKLGRSLRHRSGFQPGRSLRGQARGEEMLILSPGLTKLV